MVSNQEKTKKQWKTLSLEVPVIEGVTCIYENGSLTAKGAKGEISKIMKYPNVTISVDNNNIVIKTNRFSQREKKIMFTYKAHAKNLMKGVTEGFEYNLVIVFAKFPMTVKLSGQILQVKNLLGEKVPRVTTIPADVKVVVKGSDITVNGIDKEKTGQVAASIEQMCRITHLDRRVIQDGIFITKKPHKEYV